MVDAVHAMTHAKMDVTQMSHASIATPVVTTALALKKMTAHRVTVMLAVAQFAVSALDVYVTMVMTDLLKTVRPGKQ